MGEPVFDRTPQMLPDDLVSRKKKALDQKGDPFEVKEGAGAGQVLFYDSTPKSLNRRDQLVALGREIIAEIESKGLFIPNRRQGAFKIFTGQNPYARNNINPAFRRYAEMGRGGAEVRSATIENDFDKVVNDANQVLGNARNDTSCDITSTGVAQCYELTVLALSEIAKRDINSQFGCMVYMTFIRFLDENNKLLDTHYFVILQDSELPTDCILTVRKNEQASDPHHKQQWQYLADVDTKTCVILDPWMGDVWTTQFDDYNQRLTNDMGLQNKVHRVEINFFNLGSNL
ncbi:MAG: hypothetical protein ACR2PT_15740 [Endozoicomonas sp.]